MTRLGRLAGKTAFVTGASSGLGAHFARVMAREGAAVTVGARRTERLEALVAEIAQSGASARAVKLDVTEPDSVSGAFDGASYDIVVNNAGVTADAPALRTTEADWLRVIDTDLSGVFRVARVAAGCMQAAGRGGSIVNIASILGLRVAGNLAAYATAKAGVVHMTKALALEWARLGIRVNALCPGYIETELNRDFFASAAGEALIQRIPQRRLGRPCDLDGPLLLLASDESSFMTGSALVVDGGHLITSL